MNPFKFTLYIVVFFLLSVSSCKKGENDPFLSLRSRKARLVGEWSLKNGLENYQINNIDIKIEYSEDQKTINSNEYKYSEKLNFKKDGTYEWITKDNNATITEKGTWEFGRKNKKLEYKAKETILLHISETTTTGGDISETEYFNGDFILHEGINNLKQLVLKELRNNKLVIEAKGEHIVDEQTTSYELEKTFEQ